MAARAPDLAAHAGQGSGKTFTMSGREDVLALDEYEGADQNLSSTWNSVMHIGVSCGYVPFMCAAKSNSAVCHA